MQIIRKSAFARAGLIGNPSDGYNGKTISFSLRNFSAEAVLYEWPEVEIVSSADDQSRFATIDDLSRDVKLHGYYGGIRLVKATIKRFNELCRREKIRLHDRNFSIRYSSNIPRQVGLAGSSAIIVATLRALLEFYEVTLPIEMQPSFVLSVEAELGIPGGLQDRVIQIYEGVVSMDFAEDRMRNVMGFPVGEYEPLDPGILPNLYVAYSEDVGEPTETTHTPLRVQFDQGVPAVVNAMKRFAGITVDARTALLAGDHEAFAQLVDENFDLRNSICELQDDHLKMIQTARACGATAKFAGSGGAIVGTFTDDGMFEALQQRFSELNCQVIRPQITM